MAHRAHPRPERHRTSPARSHPHARYINSRARHTANDDDDAGLLDLSALPTSTLAQLGAPHAGYTAGKHKIESKEKMRRRGVPSPDEAEAALLAVYEPTPPRRPATISTAVGIRLPQVGTQW